jgi:2-polyprenyl-3-methyl-5-hydroxy-6-metoxy-1,4-benzoquinol methylase
MSTEQLEEEKFYSQLICPICGEKSLKIDTVSTIKEKAKERLDLLECCKCKHWWINPLPKQEYLSRLYSQSSEYVISKQWEEGIALDNIKYSIPEKYILSREKHVLNQKYLEIGIGSGNLLKAFSSRGCHCSAVEPGTWGNKSKNIYYDLSEVPLNSDFDIIVANDVLEHIESPIDMLAKLRKFANPNTRLYCSFPNKTSLRAMFCRGHWRMIRPIGHLHFFSSYSSSLIFSESSWEVIRRKKTDLFDFNEIDKNIFSKIGFINFILEASNFGDQWMICAKPSQ